MDLLRKKEKNIITNYSIKLSENFRLKEFCQSKWTPKENAVIPNKYQIYLTKEICTKILQPIRDYFDKPIIIISGIRNKKIIEAMEKKGLHPSKDTDHSYLDPEVNRWGVGAVDFYIEGINIRTIYKFIAKRNKIDSNYAFGQAILHTDYKYIHISNPITNVCSKKFCRLNKKEKRKYLKCSRHTGYLLLAVSGKGKILNL